MIDILALPLAMALNLRLWYVFFGVRSRYFVAAMIAAGMCEITARIVDARRRAERPQIFCRDRRYDLVAAILVGTGPWPIVPSLNDVSALTLAWPSVAVRNWTVVLASVLVVAVAVGRLARQLVLAEPVVVENQPL